MKDDRPPHELVLGKDLKPGDVILPWWSRTAVIVSFKDYNGPLVKYFRGGARIATFHETSEFKAKGMTISNDDYYERVLYD